tara:strand:- start:6482 stop:6757 length:276 start_codon:yes stop_codon:yes gene_type:complete
MSSGIELLDGLGIIDWEDRLNVMMITLTSVILKISDNGEGYNWEDVSKDEFVELIMNKILTIEYSDELKNEISNLFKVLTEYGEDGRSITK